jgi:hypothetical protein
VIAGFSIALIAVLGAATGRDDDLVAQRVVDQGIAVEFQAQSPAKAGEATTLRFEVRDTASNSPLSGLRPAGWLSLHEKSAAPLNCKQKVATYLGADLFNRAQVDLNTYYVLSLDDDASISVVDPLFGFGGSKLLTMLPLESPGADWALVPALDRLVVSMPKAGKLAVADTRNWKISGNIATGANPHRVVVAGNQAWVGDDNGLTVVDVKSLEAKSLHFGAVVAVTASDDGDYVFATSGHHVAIVDAHAARLLAQVEVEGAPTLLDYSRAGKSVYALDASAGRVFAIDAGKHALTQTLDVRAGATQLRFAPDGRHALLPNPDANVVQVIDAASNRVVQNIAISDAPDHVSFSDLLVYVHRRKSEIVPMISLGQIGLENQAVGAADFPAGQHALGNASLADSIVSAPDGPAVLVANPADRMIYLYKEGMAAPAGGFSTYGRAPRAVLVVDHGLRESTRGSYATAVPIQQGGLYDVVMFVDAPRVVACFTTTIGGPVKAEAPVLRVVAIDPPAHLQRGESAHLRFAIQREGAAAPRAEDVRGLAFEAPGVWQQRHDLTRLPDGSYAFDFVPPDAGTYYVWIESESLGLSRNNSQFQIYEVN